MARKTVLFRVDGGCVKDVGTGHVARALLLASELQGGHAVSFASLDKPEYEYGHARIRRHGHGLTLLPEAGYPDALRQLVTDVRPDIVVCDLFEYADEDLRAAASSGAPLVTFDHVDATRRYSTYPINAVVPRNGGSYEGPEYVVIPPPSIRAFSEVPRRIFVSFGGFDCAGLTLKVATLLARLGLPLHVDVVVSDLYADLARLKALEHASRTRIVVHVQPVNFEELLGESDIALVSGGLTLFQALAAGSAVVVISQYEHQNQTVANFEQSSAFVNLGNAEQADEHAIADALSRLVTDVERRRTLRRQATMLVDGQGLARVVRLIDDALQG